MWIFFPFKHSMLSEWKKKIRWLMAIFSIFDFRFSSYEQVLWVYSFIPFSSNNVPQWFIFYIGLAKTKTKQKKTSWQKISLLFTHTFFLNNNHNKINQMEYGFLFTKMSITITIANHTATIDLSLSRTAPSETNVLIQ